MQSSLLPVLHANETPKMKKHEPETAKHYTTADVQSACLWPKHTPNAQHATHQSHRQWLSAACLSSSQWGIASARRRLDHAAGTWALAALQRLGNLWGWGPYCWKATGRVLWRLASHNKAAPLYHMHGVLAGHTVLLECVAVGSKVADGWQQVLTTTTTITTTTTTTNVKI